MNFKNIKKYLLKNSYLFVFLFALLITNISIAIRIETLYAIDSYLYVYTAKKFFKTFDISLLPIRGTPFILFYGFMDTILGFFFNDYLIISKIIMFILDFIFYILFYLVVRKLFNEYCAFFSSVLLLFDPTFIIFSLIPYLEIFSFIFGLASLLLFLKYLEKKKIHYFMFSLLLSLISGFTRFEMFLIFSATIIIIFTINEIANRNKKKILIFLFVLIGLSIFLIPFFLNYYHNRFTPFTLMIMGLGSPEVLWSCFQDLISVTDVDILNYLFIILCIFGIFFIIFHLVKSLKKKDNRKFYSYSLIIIISLGIIFTSITFYGFTFIIENNEIKIIQAGLSFRFLMISRLFLVIFFIYGIYNFLTILLKYQKKLLSIHLLKDMWSLKWKMKNLLKNLSVILLLGTSSLINSAFLIFSYQKGIEQVDDYSISLNNFKVAANWLDANLNNGDLVFLFEDFIFYTIKPELENYGLNYQIILDKTGFIFKADNTLEDYIKIREALINEIKNNSNIKYLIIRDVNKLNIIYEMNVQDELFDLINLEKIIESKPISTGWKAKMYIYIVI